ncbi:MAG: hypothetical protein ACI94Y_002220 [Maribacter sp.]|jgi:hypothetical protein
MDIDRIPLPASNLTFIDFDFKSGMGTFTSTSSGTDQFVQGNAGASTYWSVTGNNTDFAFISDDFCNCDLSDAKLITPVMDFSTITNATLTFDHSFSNINVESAAVLVSIDGGMTWSNSVHSITNISTWSILDSLANWDYSRFKCV